MQQYSKYENYNLTMINTSYWLKNTPFRIPRASLHLLDGSHTDPALYRTFVQKQFRELVQREKPETPIPLLLKVSRFVLETQALLE